MKALALHSTMGKKTGKVC